MKSTCCNKPVYTDAIDTGKRIGQSICIRIVYKCSGCHQLTGAVSWADAGTGDESDKSENWEDIMKCSCGYEYGFTLEEIKGEFGEFFHSTFADLERRADMSKTEKARMYGCPACGRVFINTAD